MSKTKKKRKENIDFNSRWAASGANEQQQKSLLSLPHLINQKQSRQRAWEEAVET